MQLFELLTNDQVEEIHDASIQILTQIGVEFGYPPALDVLKKGGAKNKSLDKPPRLGGMKNENVLPLPCDCDSLI